MPNAAIGRKSRTSGCARLEMPRPVLSLAPCSVVRADGLPGVVAPRTWAVSEKGSSTLEFGASVRSHLEGFRKVLPLLRGTGPHLVLV